MQAAPVFQSPATATPTATDTPTPTFTPTDTPTPTITPTPTPTPIPPDLSLSYKTVSQSAAIVGDVLTYTIIIVKTGGPASVIAGEFLRPESGNVANVTHTGVANFFDYSPIGHALAWVGPMTDGLDMVTITYQTQVLTVPVGGILTNTVQFGFTSALVSREAVVFIQTPTPTFTPMPTDTPTNTPTPTATATPTNSPTAVSTATLHPTVTPRPAVTPDPVATVTPTVTRLTN